MVSNPSWIRIVLFENLCVLGSHSSFLAGWRDKQCSWEKRGSNTPSIFKGAAGVGRWTLLWRNVNEDRKHLKTQHICFKQSFSGSQFAESGSWSSLQAEIATHWKVLRLCHTLPMSLQTAIFHALKALHRLGRIRRIISHSRVVQFFSGLQLQSRWECLKFPESNVRLVACPESCCN